MACGSTQPLVVLLRDPQCPFGYQYPGHARGECEIVLARGAAIGFRPPMALGLLEEQHHCRARTETRAKRTTTGLHAAETR